MKSMALLALTMLFCTASLSHSLFPTDLSDKEKQQMMEALRQLEVCFSRIDSEEIKKLQQRSNQFASQLRSLCFNGKRDEAEKKSLAFYGNMMDISTVKQAKACADDIPPSFRSFLSTPLDLAQFAGQDGQHICDGEILPIDQFSGHRH